MNSAKSTKTLPILRRTRRTFHRHTGGGPTSSGTTRNGLRPSPEQRTPSQKACHLQSQPARAIKNVAVVGVKPAGGRKSAAMRRWHRRLRWRSSLFSLSGEDVAATLTLGGQKCPHAARSSEEDSRGSRAGGCMFKPLPPITQHTPERADKVSSAIVKTLDVKDTRRNTQTRAQKG